MKDIPKYIPVLSVMLIFLGYCHLHFFYCTQFDIEIYQFITTGEIVLSFLPIILRLFLLGIFIGVFALLPTSEKGKEENEKTKPDSHLLKLFKRSIKILLFICWIVASYYFFKKELYADVVLSVYFWGIWVTLFFVWIKEHFYLKIGTYFRKNYKIIYASCIAFLGFLLFDYITLYNEAFDIKNGVTRSAIKFEYEGKQVNTFTNQSLGYIGSTQQYIFIYDKNTGNNYIFDKSKTNNIITGIIPKFIFHINADSLKKNFLPYCDSIKKYNSLLDSSTKQLFISLCDSIKNTDSLKQKVNTKQDSL